MSNCGNTSAAFSAWSDGVVGDCGGGAHIVKWTQATGITDLGGYIGGGGFAFDVSSDGSVTVGISNHELFNGAAYYWDNAGIHRLPDAIPASTIYQSVAFTISPNGDYIGGFILELDALDISHEVAVVWDADRNPIFLKDAANNRFEGKVYGVSDRGYAVGRTRDNKGFIWHPSFDGIQSPFNGAQIFDTWLANIPNGQVLPFASKGIEAISEDPVNNRLLFALSDFEAPGASAYVEVELETVAPTVTGVYASGSTWSAAMIDAVDGGGVGAGNGLGYAISSGMTLPNAGVDRIYVQFSEPVVGFNASTVALLGVDVADYESVPGLMNVSYDSANRRGVIQLSSSLVKDKLRLGVSDAVKDLSLNALDGDANASAGGVMDLRFNVLVGDANNDGSVNGGDLPFFATAFNTSTGSMSYNPRADWNANGSVNGGDLPLFAARFNQSLPTAEPAALGFPPAMLPLLDSDSMLAPPIEEIEAFFSQLDEEDELLVFENSEETL